MAAISEFKATDPWDYKAPADRAEILTLLDRSFAWISGHGDPNGPEFANSMGALYGLCYAVRMCYRSPSPPPGAEAYTVGVLQGHWDIANHDEMFDPAHKDKLVWTIMIRQPDWLTPPLFKQFQTEARAKASKKKDGDPSCFEQIEFGTREGGRWAQILHSGPYDDEPATFAKLEASLTSQGLTRTAKTHTEVYLSDPRRTAPEKLKTILRVRVGQ